MRELRKNLFFLAAVAAVLWWLMTGDAPVLSYLRSIVGRGKRLTTTSLDDDGNIGVSPDELAAQAGQLLGRDVATDAYTLARIADSENPTATLREKAAIMQVCINDAAQHLWSIGFAATVGKGYGRQRGRRYSTARDPYEQTLTLAEAVLVGAVADETRGSSHFVHKTGFASLGAYQSLVADWQARLHIVPVKLPGVSSFRLFLPEDSYSAEETLPEVGGTV